MTDNQRKWILITNDGEKHEVEGIIRFEVKGRQKWVKGTVTGDMGMLFSAFNSGHPLILQDPDNQDVQHYCTLEYKSDMFLLIGVDAP